MVERIVAAAIRFDGVTHTMPPPARHHTIMHALDEDYWDRRGLGMEEQGFITSDGRYVDRKEAKLIAVAADQLLPGHSRLDELFSECVW